MVKFFCPRKQNKFWSNTEIWTQNCKLLILKTCTFFSKLKCEKFKKPEFPENGLKNVLRQCSAVVKVKLIERVD